MKPTVFVVEDDDAVQELYDYSLDREFESHCFSHGKEFFEAIDDELPDLVILDIMLPGADDGYDILMRLKSEKRTAHIPVIMVSAMGEELSKVKGLDLGADDYISKPFSLLEFVARVKSTLRKGAKSGEEIAYKDVKIDLPKHIVTANDNILKTTLKEFCLLRLLCENAGKIQSREVIFSEVWGDDFDGESRTLDVHIKELRKKLAEAESETTIQTIQGVGFMVM